ncbi:MAG TPA: GFA family protein [Polyangiaceae bacterium]|nr:GFA family protein [Polyangiaceae bacterium]
MNTPEIFEGRCQCGQVVYRVVGESVAFFVCHCMECQRQSASAFGMALWIKHSSKEVLEGELRSWIRNTPTGRQQVCEFCDRCGTRVFHQMSDQSQTLSIKPGTLNTPLNLEPVAHIWTSSARNWLRLPPGVLSYSQNPSSFDDIFAAWQTRKTGAQFV